MKKMTVVAAALIAITLVSSQSAFASRFHVKHHIRSGAHKLRVKMHHGHMHMHNLVHHGHM